MRPTEAIVDLAAVGANVAALDRHVGAARLCVVVKAGAYGHGAVPVAAAALEAGAQWLAVACVEEAVELVEAGIDAPVLVLSEPEPADYDEAAGLGLRVPLYSLAGVEAAERAARRTGRPLRVHVKVNTGMNRVGADPDDLTPVVDRVRRADGLVLEGLWTHFAVADDPDLDDVTADQIRRFEQACGAVGVDGLVRHASNSAGALAHPAAHYDLVRCGIAVYGVDPSPALAGAVELVPALELTSRVSLVRRVGPGAGVSYGHRWRAERATTVATVPIGYADGIRRSSGVAGVEVLVAGRRRPIVGQVTMDQLMVDCGDDPVTVGDEVVLIGRRGDDEITATEIADRLGTIPYEVLCDLGPRVRRRHR